MLRFYENYLKGYLSGFGSLTTVFKVPGRKVDLPKNQHQPYTVLKMSSSAIAEHRMQTGLKILFMIRKIIARIPYYHQRKIRETIEITEQPNNINIDNTLPPVEYLENGH